MVKCTNQATADTLIANTTVISLYRKSMAKLRKIRNTVMAIFFDVVALESEGLCLNAKLRSLVPMFLYSYNVHMLMNVHV